MSVLVSDKESANSGSAQARPPDQDVEVPAGPVSRLLAKVSKWSIEYAEYRLEHCDWRRIAI